MGQNQCQVWIQHPKNTQESIELLQQQNIRMSVIQRQMHKYVSSLLTNQTKNTLESIWEIINEKPFCDWWMSLVLL